MPIVTLMPGETLLVALEDSDGTFTIKFDADGDQKLTISADMPDSQGREGVIYCEDFSRTPDEKAKELVVEDAHYVVHHVKPKVAKEKHIQPLIATCGHLIYSDDRFSRTWDTVTCKACLSHHRAEETPADPH